MNLDSNSTHLRCALIIAAATHKWSRNQQLDLFQAFGISWPFQPMHTRRPLHTIHSLYFAHNPPTTYTQFIHQYNCWTGLMECCSQQDQDTIHALTTGRIKWIQESNNSHIPPSLPCTNAHANSSSTNLMLRLNNLKMRLKA